MINSGFQQSTLLVRTGDGLNDVLCESLVLLRKDGSMVRAPIGGTTDGLSVPRCLQNIIPATGGDWFSGVIHDSAYRKQLEVWNDSRQEWVNADFTQKQCDDLMLEAMELQGCSWIARHTIYRALRMFGWKAYQENRK